MPLTQAIVFYLFFFIAVAIYGFPRFLLKKHPTLSSEEIIRLRPKLRAIKLLYTAPIIICPTLLLVLLVAAGEPFAKPAFNETFLFFPVIMFLGLYDGLFALITGVFPMITRWEGYRFVYDPNHQHRWIAKMQIALAVAGTLLSLAMFLVYPE